MAKETRLSDSAEIYKLREEKSERQKLKNMTFKEKITYFNNYYRTKTIIGIVVIGFLIYFSYTIFGPRTETILYIASLNGAIDYDSGNLLGEEIENYLGIDTKQEEVFVDTSIYLDGTSEYTSSNIQKFSTLLMAKELDIIIADEDTFEKYANQGYFCKLSDQLPTQLFSKLSDHFYISSTEEDTDHAAYGIYLETSSLYGEDYTFYKRPVLGIVVNSEFKDNCISFIQYLFK